MTLRKGYNNRFIRFLGAVGVAGLAAAGCTSASASSASSGGRTVGTTPAATVKASEDIIRRIFGPELAPEAIEVAICESDLNPKAVSKTNDHGLFQINIINKQLWTEITGQPWSAVYDPIWNTRFTYEVWKRSHWQPWVCKYVLGL